MRSKDPVKGLEARVEVVLEARGEEVVDSRLARVLEEVERRGSLLAACRAVGAPYSRTWEKITRAEKLLGGKLLEARRGGVGGGGAALTKLGRALLKRYAEAQAKVSVKTSMRGEAKVPELVVAGSHDPALELLIGGLRAEKAGMDIEVAWLGSAGGLAALMMGDAHVAGSHLLDPDTSRYNIPFLARYWLEGRVYVVRGYRRELGLVYRPETKVRGISDLLEGELRLVNRNPGSGTRVLLDHLLRQAALDEGIDPEDVSKKVKGYDREVRTHVEVAREVASGSADVGVAVRYAASLYGLGFTRLLWEWYDLVVLKSAMRREPVKRLLSALRSRRFRKNLERMKGYKVSVETGEIIYR